MKFITNDEHGDKDKPVAFLHKDGALCFTKMGSDLLCSLEPECGEVWVAEAITFEKECFVNAVRLFYPGDKITIEF